MTKRSKALLERYRQSRNPWHRQWLLGTWILAEVRRRRGDVGRQAYGAGLIDSIAKEAGVSRATAYKAKKIAERCTEKCVLSLPLSAESAYALASLDSAQARQRALAELKRAAKRNDGALVEVEAKAIVGRWGQ